MIKKSVGDVLEKMGTEKNTLGMYLLMMVFIKYEIFRNIIICILNQA